MIVELDDDTIPTGNAAVLAEVHALTARPVVVLDWGAATTIGARGGGNEDAWGREGSTFAVADGMGGQGGGAFAAQTAVERFFNRVAGRAVDWRQEMFALNRDVRAAAAARDIERVGTTLLAATLAEGRATVVHVGDSRAYRWTVDGRLDLLTSDHNVRSELLAAGLEIGEYRARGVALHGLTSFIGLDAANLRVDVFDVSLRPGDRLLLCTDGIHHHVSMEHLRQAFSAPTCQAAAGELIARAEANGGRDNATAVVVAVGIPTGGAGR